MSDTFSPTALVQIELTEPIPEVVEYNACQNAFVLVRCWTRPIGISQMKLPATRAAVIEHIQNNHLADIELFCRTYDVAMPAQINGKQFHKEKTPQFLLDRQAYLEHAPKISVVVGARDCPTDQLAVTLDSLLALEYPNFEVVLVENVPTSDTLQRFVAEHYPDRIRYVVENRPGLSWARNCGFAHATGEIVVFTDDDVILDKYWLVAIAQAFEAAENVGCVTGLTQPQLIRTQAQAWFEEFGGATKGRGFGREIHNITTHATQDPLFPAPGFGSGANMAFRASVLREIGGFDVALGAGTFTKGAEDTAAFYDCLMANHTLIYEPAALIFHNHRETFAELQDQLFGYSLGVTAFYTRCILRNPAVIFRLIGLAPKAITYMFGRDSKRTQKMSDNYPRELHWIQLKGLFAGPLAYLKARAVANRLARGEQTTARPTVTKD